MHPAVGRAGAAPTCYPAAVLDCCAHILIAQLSERIQLSQLPAKNLLLQQAFKLEWWQGVFEVAGCV